VGAKVDFGRVAATLAAFTATRPTYARDPNTLIFGETGKERYQGIEFTAFGEVTESVRFIGGVTLLDPTLVETPDGSNIGKRTVGQPKYRTTLSMEWDTPFVPGLTLNATGQWQSSTYLDSANLQRVAGWYSIDLGARYTINLPDREPIILRATVRNVLDANVWIASRNGLSLATPRTFLLSSTFKF
jgi:iron complex outermembrane receptor protein